MNKFNELKVVFNRDMDKLLAEVIDSDELFN